VPVEHHAAQLPAQEVHVDGHAFVRETTNLTYVPNLCTTHNGTRCILTTNCMWVDKTCVKAWVARYRRLVYDITQGADFELGMAAFDHNSRPNGQRAPIALYPP
jgi:hypothetical protein